MKPVFPVLTALLFLTAHRAASTAEPKPDPTKQITDSIGMKLILIPSGEFQMGTREKSEATAAFFKERYGTWGAPAAWLFDADHPQHRVRITRPFFMGAYNVTRGQFRRFVTETGYDPSGKGGVGIDPETKQTVHSTKYSWRDTGFLQTDDHPVLNVNWYDAVEFCKWLGKKEGRAYRLPTEAEWEYAARAGTTTRFSVGDDPEKLATVANIGDARLRFDFPNWQQTIKASDGYVFTAPVGSFKPNPWGLYDMHGNAGQWCSDWYGEDYYEKSPVNDPRGPDSGERRVERGCFWGARPDCAQSAFRCGGCWPYLRGATAGFRAVRDR